MAEKSLDIFKPSFSCFEVWRKFSEQKVPLFISGSGAPCFWPEENPSLPKVFILSMPKAGTFLLHDFLVNSGFASPGVQIAPWGFLNFRGLSFETFSTEVHLRNVFISNVNFLTLFLKGQVGLGHLPYSESNMRSLHGFKVILLHRRPPDALASFVAYSHRLEFCDKQQEITNHQVNEYAANFLNIVEPMLGWFKDSSGLLSICFGNLSGRNGANAQQSTLEAIYQFIGEWPHHDDISQLRKCLPTSSLTLASKPSFFKDIEDSLNESAKARLRLIEHSLTGHTQTVL